MKRFVTRRLVTILCSAGVLGLSTQAMASSFQLWEQDGVGIGNYHAGYALGNDASTSFYNPAGITNFKNQQLVVSVDPVMPSFIYRGSIVVDTLLAAPRTFSSITRQGAEMGIIPAVHYVAPISDAWGFGFSVDIPFGLKTNYGNSLLRYSATLSSLTVVDISPSLAYKVLDNASLGFGVDAQKAYAELDQTGTANANTFTLDSSSTNKASDTGYGFHMGAMYDPTPSTRIGLSYHSKVRHHLTGSSTFAGPSANLIGGTIRSSNAYTNITLPPYTALSASQDLCNGFKLLGSVIFTQWNSIQAITLNNLAGSTSVGGRSTTLQAVIPTKYRNTWNVSFGTDYTVSSDVKVRGAIGVDQTPTSTSHRIIRVPDNNRLVLAVGGHYQATTTMGMDLGWSHYFVKDASIRPASQTTGSQTTTTSGTVSAGADVIGAQLTWDIV